MVRRVVEEVSVKRRRVSERVSIRVPTEEPEQEEERQERRVSSGGSNLRAAKRGDKRRNQDDRDDEGEGSDEYDGGGGEGEGGGVGEGGADPVSKLVRLALALEYQKKPIRRQDITEKVLGQQFKADFKSIFSDTQSKLRQVFGYQLVELPPQLERVTLAQQRRQAAQDAQKGAAGAKKKGDAAAASGASKSWHLVSILPEKFRLGTILGPILSDEQTLHGFGTMVIMLVYLSNRSLSENVLMRHLRKLQVEERIPVEGNKENGKVENILAKLVRDGHLAKLKDEVVPGQEQSFTYVIGPRAKVEIGREGVASFVKKIWGEEIEENFDRKVNRAIGVDAAEKLAAADDDEDDGAARAPQRGRGRAPARGGGGRGKRRRNDSDEDEDEEEEEESYEDE